ncbi:MAG TPA: hypothetical protein VFE52_06330 [Devosia sp.]|jgi:3-(3-hydroxy-phenyl)propionate hydroxylase|nr:hypothetical protein [Devosia sp.]
MSGLSTRYHLGAGHPLLGHRVPDLDLATGDGSVPLYSHLRDGSAVLFSFDGGSTPDVAHWSSRVRLMETTYAGEWTLPVIGPVPAPTSVLVRPDGHVAWVGTGSDAGLHDALTRWLGP